MKFSASMKLHYEMQGFKHKRIKQRKNMFPNSITMLYQSATSRVTNFGKPSSNDIKGAFENKKSGDVVILSDGVESTNYFAKKMHGKLEQVKKLIYFLRY